MSGKDTIQSAIKDMMTGDTSAMKEKINSSLFAKVADALKTKKMEISNKWLNDLEAPSSDNNDNEEE
jgi:hypothetical protein